MSDFLWVEKYRPKTIDECILPADTKEIFNGFLEKGEINNLLLAGTAGIGKTTIAKALCTQLGVDYIVINRSHDYHTTRLFYDCNVTHRKEKTLTFKRHKSNSNRAYSRY